MLKGLSRASTSALRNQRNVSRITPFVRNYHRATTSAFHTGNASDTTRSWTEPTAYDLVPMVIEQSASLILVP